MSDTHSPSAVAGAVDEHSAEAVRKHEREVLNLRDRLARSERLASLVTLAAGAAHELGTPLATIALVSREIERAMPAGASYADDIRLLRQQTERCGAILARITSLGSGDAPYDRMPLSQLIDEVVAPHRPFGTEIAVVLPEERGAEPEIARNPGISQTKLSHANGRDKSSLTPVVEDLVRRGLVERKRMRADRRTYRLNVTLAGKRALVMLTRCARRHELELDRIIGRRDRKRFLQILKKIAAEIE